MVRSFVAGLSGGWEGAFKTLDANVSELGPIKISQLADMVLFDPTATEKTRATETHIVRVVVFEPEELDKP